MNFDSILNFLSKFKTVFQYLLGYFMGAKIQRLTTEQKRIKKEKKQREELYEVLHHLDRERRVNRAEYDRVRKERGDKPYIVDL
jgi:glucose-6-phosphate-specific signal transduction histidine kinase